MADPSPSRHVTADSGAEPLHSSGSPNATYPGTPRWVKVSGIVVLALILLFVVVEVASGGQHNPMRHMHMSSGAANGPGAHTLLAAQGVEHA